MAERGRVGPGGAREFEKVGVLDLNLVLGIRLIDCLLHLLILQLADNVALRLLEGFLADGFEFQDIVSAGFADRVGDFTGL